MGSKVELYNINFGSDSYKGSGLFECQSYFYNLLPHRPTFYYNLMWD